MSRLPMLSGASKMVFDPSRCNQSSTSTVRRGGLSTKKAGNQRLPNEIPKQPNNGLKTGRERHQRAIGDNPQVSIPESGLAGLVCFSSVSFFSRQGFLAS